MKNEAFEFNWNRAVDSDWQEIKRFFVAAYLKAYQDCAEEKLGIVDRWKQKATSFYESAYQKALHQGFHYFNETVLEPFQYYTAYLPGSFVEESQILGTIALGKADKSFFESTRNKIIRPIMIQQHFENLFEVEKEKIISKRLDQSKIHYLLSRLNEKVTGFFSCQLNPHSGRVYVRYVAVSPVHQRLGLGRKMIQEISNFFPENRGLELFTRKANLSSQEFYTKCGFLRSEKFNFRDYKINEEICPKLLSEHPPIEKLDDNLYPPLDEQHEDMEPFIGFYINRE